MSASISTSSDQKVIVSLVNYPQTLMFGKYEYDLYFNLTSTWSSTENIKVIVVGDDYKIKYDPIWQQGVQLQPQTPSQCQIKLQPKKDGLTSVQFQVIWLKLVQYTEMVWKVREQIEQSHLNEILGKKTLVPLDLVGYRQKLPDHIDKGDLEPILKTEAEEKLIQIQSPPPPREVAQEPITDPTTGELVVQPPKIVQDPPLPPEQQDPLIIELARRVFENDPEYGYELLRKISNRDLALQWLEHFISVGVKIAHQSTLNEILNNIPEEKRDQYLEMLAYATATVNGQDAAMITLNISDTSKRDQVLTQIILTLSQSSPDVAANLVYQISEHTLQSQVLFEVIKNWANIDKAQAISSLQSLITNILSDSNQEFIKKAMIFLASLTSPQSVIDLINSFDNDSKEQLIEQLKDYLQVQVEEIREKIDETLIYNQIFQFPCVVQRYSESVEYLARLIGNISPNLLSSSEVNQQAPNTILLSPFGYNFPIGLTFQQLFLSQPIEIQRNLGYIIFPSQSELSEQDSQHLRKIFTDFIPPSGLKQIIILDLIPYLSKPYISISGGAFGGSSSSMVERYSSMFKSAFTNSVIIKIDSGTGFFSENDLQQKIWNIIISSLQTSVNLITMVLNYNFFHETKLLNRLIGLLGKI